MLDTLLPAASTYGAHFNEFTSVARALRDAPAEAASLLGQRYSELSLTQIAEELVKAGLEMLEILALGAGIGGALGAIAGALAGGVGVVATTAIGASVGAQVAMYVTGAMGVVVAIEDYLNLISDAVTLLWHGIEDAWHAGEAGSGSLTYDLKMAEAKHKIAQAIVILAGILLEIIIAVILKKKPGLEKFKNSPLGKKLEGWAEDNKDKLASWYERKTVGGNKASEQNALSELADEAKEKLDGATGAVNSEVKKTEDALNAGNSNTSGVNGNGERCPAIANTCTSGEPISMVTGEELLELNDFAVNGLIPLSWKRVYRTSNCSQRGLGYGWTHPLSETLTLKGKYVIFSDAEGRYIELPLPAVGQYSTNNYEGLLLQRLDQSTFRLKAKNRPDRIFQGAASLRLIALVDAVGNRWVCHYGAHRIESVRSSWGVQLLFTHTDSGLIESISLQHANAEPVLQVKYRYSAEKDLVEVEDSCGDAEEYAYHNHIITQRTLRTGYRFHFEWTELTSRAKCLRQYGDNENYNYRFEWNASARVSRSIDSNGGILEIHYNNRGQVEKQIDPLGYAAAFQYNENGFLTNKTDALENVWTYQYDAHGNLLSVSGPAQAQSQLEYDSSYRLISYTDALGHKWSREFNEQGLVGRNVDAEGNGTEYFYNAQGLPELIIDALGRKRRFTWSESGFLLSQQLEETDPIQYHHNELSQVTAVEQAGRTTRYEYNIKGDIAAVHYPDGSRTRLQYNSNRQLTAYTDAIGRTTRFEYDGLSQVVRKIDPAGHVLEYIYDHERNLIGLRNEKGEQYQLKYDANERLISEIGFDGRVQQYEYNPLGHLIAHIEGHYAEVEISEREKNTARFERDALGRLIQKRMPDGDTAHFKYDALGRLIHAENAARTLEFEYTANGYLQAEFQDGKSIEHRYDALGNRIASILPNGQVLKIDYDENNQFSAMALDGQHITQIERDAFGAEIKREQGKLSGFHEYDPAGRLARHYVSGKDDKNPIIERKYHYDAVGRLQGIDDLKKGPLRYVYDSLDRLSAVEGYAAEKFDFDPAGNILSGQGAAQEKSVAPGNRLQFHGDKHFSYDARGNLVEEKRGQNRMLVTRYTYNAQNQLVDVEKNGQHFEYAYDALGRRVKKKDTFGETEFLWDGDVLLSEKRNHLEKVYLYEPNSFRPLAFVESEKVYFYHLDHLGTPQEMTDWEGRVVWSARYRVYGNVLRQEVEAVENHLRFQGQYFDEETGLHYNRFRYYDPGVGRFINQDPIGLLGGVNNYEYAPNAVGWVDPFGLTAQKESAERAASSVIATKPDFYVGPSGPDSTLPATGYRYMEYQNANGVVGQYAQQAINTKNARLSYFGFDKFESGDEVTEAFQVRAPKHVTPSDPGPAWSDGRLRLEFDTLQLYENGVPKVSVPYSHGGKGVDLEPFTTAYPNYGTGGARQLIPNGTMDITAEKVDILPP